MWQEQGEHLYRQFKFKDFKQAFDFMIKVAEAAENLQHHPRWTNEYSVVDIWLSTHSEGKVTDQDHQLSKQIDRIYEDFKV
jgi:4a-hydroxytetrahydrobiopterin dehydratase